MGVTAGPGNPHAGPKRAPSYDARFRPAVEAGFLTVRQAIQRGNRRAFAARIAQRHGLPLKVAFEVADNRISLREATRQKAGSGVPRQAREAAAPAGDGRSAAVPAAPARAAPRSSAASRYADAPRSAATRRSAATPLYAETRRSVDAPRPAATAGKVIIIIAASVAAVAMAYHGWSTWKDGIERNRRVAQAAAIAAEASAAEEAAPVPTAATDVGLRAAEVLVDEFGRVTRVSGPDPRSVLDAFCGSVAGLEPLQVTETRPPFAGARLGKLQDENEWGVTFAIRIKRDSSSSRWVTGNGRLPISPDKITWQ